MALVQAAFIGSVVVFPNHFGAGSATKQELEGYLHLWRVIGYYLGVKDSCNLAKMETLEESRYVEQKKLLRWEAFEYNVCFVVNGTKAVISLHFRVHAQLPTG